MATSIVNGLKPKASKDNNTFKASVGTAGLFPRNGPDPSARPWSHDDSGSTFSAQHKAPKQPLPSLESSCQRYLEAVKPLQSAEEHESSVAAAQSFLEGEGPKLQAQLEAYGEGQANWFEHYCYEAFLGDDSPVVLNSNAFCSFVNDPNPSRNDQIARATSLVRSAVAFSQAIRDDRLPLDVIKGTPQCMNQYWWLFGVSRVPENDGGRLRMDADARHIMIMCRGQTYSLEVIEEGTNKIIGEEELSQSLQDITKNANSIPIQEASKTSIGVFTTENQKIWSHARKDLINSSLQNGRNIGLIDSSLFVLCLDESSPSSDADIGRNMICGTNTMSNGIQTGTCLNRWYDKLAIIVCRNGAAGMNFEHTCTDGSVDIAMASEIYKGSISTPSSKATTAPNDSQPHPALGISNGVSAPTPNSAFNPQYKHLAFTIPPSLAPTLQTAQAHLKDRIEAHQLSTLHFTLYGTTFMKSVAKVSPDAFFQLVLQAAYYSTYKRVVSGFEPVLMRQYLHGRTDVIRTTTSEALDFARAYSELVDAEEGGTKEAKTKVVELLRKAALKHVSLSKTCAAGGSHHRHLYVLQQLWKKRRASMEINDLSPPDKHPQNKNHTIFEDPGWQKLNTTVLMGSNVDNDCLAYAGFGPPSQEGFTVCYYLRGESVGVSVCSRNGGAEGFRGAIEKTLRELRGVCEGV